MDNRRRIVVSSAAIFAIAITAGAIVAWPNEYEREMRPVYAAIAAGEQGWADRATDLLDSIVRRSADRRALAERLVRESDGSLVAEGMLLAVRAQHPQARPLVQQQLSDARWNWYLANNDELARGLLLHLDGKPSERWIEDLLTTRATTQSN